MSEEPDLRILIIDDNPEIHKDFIKILTKNLSTDSTLNALEAKVFGTKGEQIGLPQFYIDTASQGKEGVEYVQRSMIEGKNYALAFVDIRMPPGWDGIETIKHIWALDPDIQVVICTAYSDYSWEETISELGQKDNLLILKKPFDSIAVRQLACALTKKWQLIRDAKGYTSMLNQKIEDKTASLQKSLSLVKATLESSGDGILVVNNDGGIVDYNQKFISMWKVPAQVLNEKNSEKLREFMNNQLETNTNFFATMAALYDDLEAVRIEILKFKDGKVFEYYTQPQKINEKTVGRVFDFRDITNRVKLEKKLEYQANHDSLTGLPNRVMLLEKIKSAIRMAEDNNTIFALLFLDLDRFKLINDSLSHSVGDEVLQITADRLQSSMREQDTLARLGGDEFIIIFTNFTDERKILDKVKKIQEIFQNPFLIENRNLIVTSSIGISLYPKDGKTPDLLLRNADAAMYQAKEMRGNSFQFYTDELNVECVVKLDKEMQLRQAITNNELFLCYQPQIDLSTGKIIAAEALIRWNHPEKGVLLPLDFIPLAEDTGLIVPMSEWVIREACKQNKAWQNAGLPPIRVAVNITAQQFSHQNVVELVVDILKEVNLEPQFLELELTENAIVSNLEIIKALTELKKLGVSIAIDDFGTGYSSLSYLKKIPLDRLKIDSSFIQHIKTKTDDEVIVRAVIAIAKNMNLAVLAEGVETQNQLDFLKLHECGNVQGFYFSSPLTSKELEVYLNDPSKIKKIINKEAHLETMK